MLDTGEVWRGHGLFNPGERLKPMDYQSYFIYRQHLFLTVYSKMADDKNSVDMIDQKKVPHILSTIDGDVALEDLVIEDRERKEKALVRKVDTRMMPLMMLLCAF
jgi:hypothetical protein